MPHCPEQEITDPLQDLGGSLCERRPWGIHRVKDRITKLNRKFPTVGNKFIMTGLDYK